MKKRLWLKRAILIGLVVCLLLIFSSVSHSCDHSHCPVCMLTAAFRLGLGVMALALGLVFLPCFVHRLTDLCVKAKGGDSTLVALKVKLSD